MGKIVNKVLSDFLQGVSGTQFFSWLLSTLLTLGLVIGTLYFIFNFLFGAIAWMTAGSSREKLERARKSLTVSLVGLVVLFSFFAIVNLISCFFGLDLFRISITEFQISFGKKLGC